MRQLVTPTILEVGKYYTNDQIHYALDVANLGGIRPKLNSQKELDFVVLITSTEADKDAIRNPYADRIEEDILTYTGAGLKGEQHISGVNKRLLEQIDKPIPILGFIKEDTNKYKFIGFLYLLRHYEDYQLDHEGSMRKVLVFEFKIISEIPSLKIGEFTDPFTPIFNKIKENTFEGDTSIAKEAAETETIDAHEVERLRDVEKMKLKFMTVDPYRFEVVVSNLISHVGFSDVRVTKKSGDDGVDVNATLRNPVSINLQYSFQVKRWKHSVGRNEVANLRGSMGLNTQGVIISTSHFTASAIREAGSEYKTPINLIGINELHHIIGETSFPVERYVL